MHLARRKKTLNPRGSSSRSIQTTKRLSSGFGFALNWNQGAVKPGAYKISKAMNAWEIAKIFEGSPYMKWVVIPEGLRKEEIAEILRQELGWSEDETRNWITKDTTARANYIEGVYFPDTYLIPTDEASSDVARRLQPKFHEKYGTARGRGKDGHAHNRGCFGEQTFERHKTRGGCDGAIRAWKHR